MRNCSRAWTSAAVVLAAAAVIMVAPYQAQAFLVVNGGFEDDSQIFDPQPFPGWTLSGDTGSPSLVTDPVHSGIYAASLGLNEGVGTLAQTTPLATTAGVTYTIDFWLTNFNGGNSVTPPDSFVVLWNNLPPVGGTLTNVPGSTSFTEYTFTVTATGSSTNLAFDYTNPNQFFILDDVSVTPSAVSGPASLVLVGLGLVLLGGAGWRRQRQTQ
jgi:flagellin